MAKKKNVNERISEALNIEHEIIDAEIVEEPKTEIVDWTIQKKQQQVIVQQVNINKNETRFYCWKIQNEKWRSPS